MTEYSTPLAAASDGPQAIPPVFTFEEIMAQFLRWGGAWADQTINFSFYNARPPHLGDQWWAGFQPFTQVQREATYRAFDLIADVVNLDFQEVADNQLAPGANNRRITFGTSTSFPAWATGAADVTFNPLVTTPEGRQRIDSSETLFNYFRWGGMYEPGSRNFSVLLHEILHGLGVPHPGDYNRNADEEITYTNHADYAQDTGQYTVMSYFGAWESGADHLGSFGSTLLLHDVAAMQLLYGANMTTRTGDTVYGFNSTTGRVSYDFNVNTRPVVTIWDAGGQDTLDCSGYAMNQIIDLRAGLFSNIGGLTSNVSIAFGAVIENAIGGAGADQITGNDADNRLEGGAGDDWFFGGAGFDFLIGGAGLDRARFEGRAEGYFMKQGDDGRWVVVGDSGSDLVEDIEQIVFDDFTLAPGEQVIVCRVEDTPVSAKGAVDEPEVLPAASPGGWLI